MTASTTSILGVTATKNYLKVEHAVDDTLINTLMAVAVAKVEQYTGLATGVQTWRQDEDGGIDEIELIKRPLQSVLEVKEFDDFDSTGTLLTESTDFRVAGQYLVNKDDYWDKQRAHDGYQIKFTAGLATGDYRISIMETVALRLVAWLYENREEYVTQVGDAFNVVYDFSKTPPGVLDLLRPISEEVGF